MTPDLVAAAQRLLAAVQRLPAHPGPARILDLGCGAGRDLAWFDAALAD